MEKFLNPEEILKKVRPQKDMTAADFGSGSGGWVIPLAKKLEEGKVYAIDILEEPLSALKSKTQLAKIFNIETIKSDVERVVRISNNSCDLVLMTNLLFEVENKKAVLGEGKRILKEGGKILVVDWKKDSPLGPKEGRVLPEEIKKIGEEIELKLENEFEASIYHWGLILVK